MFECLFSYLYNTTKSTTPHKKSLIFLAKPGIPLVFLDKVKIVPADDDSPVHFSTVACSSNDATSNRHSASEWAFLINVSSCVRQIKDTNPQSLTQQAYITEQLNKQVIP
jgi:hypothetical protein